ncbi:MAG: NAD(P)H-hydrate epimerase [Candidatus Omnitrophica bacterium]|nr:NAD(P)H-hydrate epimerase [Candidatus Omnitrophota bacterium]
MPAALPLGRLSRYPEICLPGGRQANFGIKGTAVFSLLSIYFIVKTMTKSYPSSKLKEIDRRAQEEYGIPGIVLMENAGIKASEIALKLLAAMKSRKAIIFCGPGNNGGDSFVIARHLFNNKVMVKVFVLASEKRLKGDSLINYLILKKMGVCIIEVAQDKDIKKIKSSFSESSLVVDAIFGIGLNKRVEGVFEKVINLINKSASVVLSVDIPSGLNADTGDILGVCVKAHTTVTFGAAKNGFYKQFGPKMTGRVVVADISLPKKLLN